MARAARVDRVRRRAEAVAAESRSVDYRAFASLMIRLDGYRGASGRGDGARREVGLREGRLVRFQLVNAKAANPVNRCRVPSLRWR